VSHLRDEVFNYVEDYLDVDQPIFFGCITNMFGSSPTGHSWRLSMLF